MGVRGLGGPIEEIQNQTKIRTGDLGWHETYKNRETEMREI